MPNTHDDNAADDDALARGPTIRPGTALPTMISSGCNGDTSNCSNVPSSRSRATDMPTIINTMVIGRVAIRMGTMALR